MATRMSAWLGIALLSSATVTADDKVTLREQLRPGQTAVVSLEFQAEGSLLIPQLEQKDRAQSFSAKGRLAFEEKIIESAPISDGAANETAGPPSAKSLRYYTTSKLESVVENKPVARELRGAVRLIVAELRDGRPFLFSPSAPLTVEEYELIEADANLDSLSVGGLLPSGPVARGETWRPANEAVAAIFNLTHIGKNEVQVKLDTVDATTATMSMAGHVEGICNGTATLRTFSGRIQFHRAQSCIVQIDLAHREQRKAGPLGSALDVRANYTFRRNMDALITELSDEALGKVPLVSNTATELLLYSQPDGRYRLHVPRGWFVTMNHPHAVIFRLLEKGEFVSECHLLAAPTVTAGTHMKPEEFRSQVQQALGKQFQEFLQEGEVPGPKGYWFYRLAAAGTAGDQPAIWIYHLVAGPQGHQIVCIFRLHASQYDNFGVRDLALIGTLEFEPSKTAANQ
jgi:hypothetical protein